VTYDEAMATIHRNGTAEVGRAGMRIRWRFGRPVVLRGEGGHIDYTPTNDDMHAGDWEMVTEPLPESWTVARRKY
jgi:hypothetical protein